MPDHFHAAGWTLRRRGGRRPGPEIQSVLTQITAKPGAFEVGEAGRVAAQSADAQASRAETQRRNAIAQHAWKNSSGLTEQTYDQEIQPGLSKLSISAIAAALGVSWSYAADIRRGRRRPHARHWSILAKLVNLPVNENRK